MLAPFAIPLIAVGIALGRRTEQASSSAHPVPLKQARAWCPLPCGSGDIPERWPKPRRSFFRALASGPLSQPIIAGKRVNRHRLARAPVASAAYRESELGCHAAGCSVSPVRDVRRDRLDVGAAEEIVDRRFHRFSRDAGDPAGPRSPTSPPRLRRGRCPRCRRRRDAARRSRGSSCPACPGRPTGRSRARATGHRPRGCRARRPLHSSMHEHGRTRRGLSSGRSLSRAVRRLVPSGSGPDGSLSQRPPTREITAPFG